MTGGGPGYFHGSLMGGDAAIVGTVLYDGPFTFDLADLHDRMSMRRQLNIRLVLCHVRWSWRAREHEVRICIFMVHTKKAVRGTGRSCRQWKVANEVVVVAKLPLLSELRLPIGIELRRITEHFIAPSNQNVRRIARRNGVVFTNNAGDLGELERRLPRRSCCEYQLGQRPPPTNEQT